jgi:L-rhamnose isomerase/sugar isomerase
VDRAELKAAREKNDVMMAFMALRRAYNLDVSPILAAARVETGGAAEPIAMYRECGWRAQKATERKMAAVEGGII